MSLARILIFAFLSHENNLKSWDERRRKESVGSAAGLLFHHVVGVS